MNHYIAYHSVEKMGRDYVPGTEFSFITRKPAGLVLAPVGATAWIVIGRPLGRGTQYLLAGAYTPRDVREDGGEWLIEGAGTPLVPRLDITSLPWFAVLKREQNNFSYGFNRIREAEVIGALTDIVPAATVTQR